MFRLIFRCSSADPDHKKVSLSDRIRYGLDTIPDLMDPGLANVMIINCCMRILIIDFFSDLILLYVQEVMTHFI